MVQKGVKNGFLDPKWPKMAFLDPFLTQKGSKMGSKNTPFGGKLA